MTTRHHPNHRRTRPSILAAGAAAAAVLALTGCGGMMQRGSMPMDSPSAGPMSTTPMDAECAPMRLQAAEGRMPAGMPMHRAGMHDDGPAGREHGGGMMSGGGMHSGGMHGPMSQPLASQRPTQAMRCGVDRSEVYVNP
jgi:hypothetical protein